MFICIKNEYVDELVAKLRKLGINTEDVKFNILKTITFVDSDKLNGYYDKWTGLNIRTNDGVDYIELSPDAVITIYTI